MNTNPNKQNKMRMCKAWIDSSDSMKSQLPKNMTINEMCPFNKNTSESYSSYKSFDQSCQHSEYDCYSYTIYDSKKLQVSNNT